MALLRLFDPTTQFQTKSGALNVAGKLRIYIESTDDLANIYGDDGSLLSQPLILDSNGRARGLFVDSGLSYRLEAYDRNDSLLFTIRRLEPNASGTIINPKLFIKGTPDEIDVEDSVTEKNRTYTISLSAKVTGEIAENREAIVKESEARKGADDELRKMIDGISKVEAGTASPLMDGKASVGNSLKYAREDHVHPTDTSRASASHTHGNITNDGKIGSTANLVVVTGTSGAVTTADLTTASPTVPTSGTTTSLEFIDTVGQDSKGKIRATKKAVPVDSTYSSTGTNPVNGKAIAAAIGGLDSNKTSTDGTNVQVKVTLADGKVSAVNVTTDNTENKSNKVSSWQTTPDNTHYPSEKLVKDSLGAKADKVSGATSGNFAGLDSNGNLMDSGSKASDFATSEQGRKADSAIQGVKVNNTTLTPDANKIVTVPLATKSADGAMSAADKTKLDGIAAGTASPLMDGNASVGNSLKYAREDHIHPSDTSREDIANKTTVVLGTSDSKYPTDKAVAEFVNSSISTNTANYISNNGEPFTSVEQLEAYSGPVTNNDYASVTGIDSDGNTYYDRYKATVSGETVTWALEYRLNNSSFTAAQWSAINSGITSALVAKIHTHSNKDVLDGITSSDVASWNSKQNSLTAGDNITIDGSTISSDQVFVATYGTTKYAEVKAAYDAGKICTIYYNTRCYYLSEITDKRIKFAITTPDPNIYSLTLTSDDKWSSYAPWLQTHLTFDATPTAGSTNPVTSEGIKTALEVLQSNIETTYATKTELNAKQNNLTAGDNITIDGNTISSNQLFVAKYGTTTYAEVKAAFNAGKICTVLYAARYFYVNRIDSTNILFVSSNGGDEMYWLSLTSGNSWSFRSGKLQSKLTFDTTPTAGSTNPVTSEGIKTALDLKANGSDLTAHTGNTTVHITAAERTAWNAKQSALTFDATPTAGSTNPVTSEGIKTAIDTVNKKGLTVKEISGEQVICFE